VSHETLSRPSSFARIDIARLVAFWALAIVCAAPRAARANGAFPESFQLVLPADRPQQIALATNFGLMISDDDGATWSWTCEMEATMNGFFYGVSAPPADRFFSLSSLVGFAYSDDSSCSWKTATGTIERVVTTDYFADPTDPARVIVLGASPDPTQAGTLLPSMDGGATFGDPIFTAPVGATFAGVEIVRSAPQTIYISMYTSVPAPGIHPKLARTIDGGMHWDTLDLEPLIGGNNFRIIAVDPDDAKTISLRVVEPDGDTFAISHDGGGTFMKPFKLDGGSLTAYARLDAMTVFVGGAVKDQGRGFRSTDGAMTFQDWTQPTSLGNGTTVPTLHLSALAARGGKLYAAAKNYSDSVAVAVSTDAGLTFRKLMSYEDVKSIRACAQDACYDSCRYQSTQQVWDAAICGKAPQVAEPPPMQKTGCGCRIGGAGGARGAIAVVALLAAAGFVTRSRRRR
jgi:MYXO-CTERM domain-containing protein